MSLALSFMLVLLTAHWVGDFVLQSDWMAINKSKCWDALLVHVTIYSATLAVAMIGFCWWAGGVAWSALGILVVFNFVVHFAIDAATSRLNAWLYPRDRHWFFVAIGFDQLLHMWTLGITAASVG